MTEILRFQRGSVSEGQIAAGREFLMARIIVEGYMCERCAYAWVPRRQTTTEPKVCPKCKSPYWNKPRQINWPHERRAAQQSGNVSRIA